MLLVSMADANDVSAFDLFRTIVGLDGGTVAHNNMDARLAIRKMVASVCVGVLVVAVTVAHVAFTVVSSRTRGRAAARSDDEGGSPSDLEAGQNAGSGGGVADELAKLNDLKANGVISQDEFEAQQAKLLA